MNRSIIRIGNASGFWGDDPSALARLLQGPVRLDYLTLDFLAEVSMSILRKQMAQNAERGYAQDFVRMLSPLLPEILQKGSVVVCNAGGLNPHGCAKALCAAAKSQGLSLKVAVVSGDDVLPLLQQPQASQQPLFKSLDSGSSLADVQRRLTSANAYLGARPIAEALRWKPQVVVTGRVIDAGLTLGPLIHEFGWAADDWDRLAAGICAGHLIECGAQVCGGNFTDFEKVPSYQEIGFPFVECAEDGSFVVCKQPGSGGLVSAQTVKEQLLYEVGDPAAYVVPDCSAVFSEAEVREIGPDRVAVSGVKGKPCTSSYKVSASYEDGYRFTHSLVVSGPNLRKKIAVFSQILRDKFSRACSQAGIQVAPELVLEAVGDSALDPDSSPAIEPQECLLRISACAAESAALEILRKLVPALILIGPPGVCVLGGNPAVSQVLGYWPCLIEKGQVEVTLELFEQGSKADAQRSQCARYQGPVVNNNAASALTTGNSAGAIPQASPTSPARQISSLAYARSGDKGDKANIAVIARGEEQYQYLLRQLSADKLKSLLPSYCPAGVTRYEAPKLLALNFLIERALPGGGAKNLRLDPQGKTLAQTLLKRSV